MGARFSTRPRASSVAATRGIVLPDADPEAISEGLFWGAFINTGQTCAALKRLYVHEDIYDEVCHALTNVASAMPMGVGTEEAHVLGPLQNKAQFDIVASLVSAAKAAGGRVLLGGNSDPEQVGFFYPTTLIADLDHDNPLVREEQFGPALRSSNTPASTKPSTTPMTWTSASAPPSGRAIRTKAKNSHAASKPERFGLTSTAPSTREYLLAA